MSVKPHPADLLLGPNDRFLVVKAMTPGGFGVTYECADRARGGAKVVVKELAVASLAWRDDATGSIVVAQEHRAVMERVRHRFLREVHVLQRLATHPCPYFVHIIEAWEQYDTVYYAMEYIENIGSMDEALRRTPIDLTRERDRYHHVQRTMLQLLEALEVVHTEISCHGDIKPANLLVRRKGGDIVLIDFGTARTDHELANANTVYATANWAAPELRVVQRLREAGPWSDLYAWGLMVYGFCLPLGSHAGDGTPWPLDSNARLDPATDPYRNAYRDLVQIGVDPSWARAVDACLRLRPGDRPPSAAALRAFLTPSSGASPHTQDTRRRLPPHHPSNSAPLGAKDEAPPMQPFIPPQEKGDAQPNRSDVGESIDEASDLARKMREALKRTTQSTPIVQDEPSPPVRDTGGSRGVPEDPVQPPPATEPCLNFRDPVGARPGNRVQPPPTTEPGKPKVSLAPRDTSPPSTPPVAPSQPNPPAPLPPSVGPTSAPVHVPHDAHPIQAPSSTSHGAIAAVSIVVLAVWFLVAISGGC